MEGQKAFQRGSLKAERIIKFGEISIYDNNDGVLFSK